MFASPKQVVRSLITAPLAALSIGCASPGPPQPPSLHLPSPVKDLHAERIGDRVLLTWTTPSEATDGQAIRTPITAVLCRETIADAHSVGQHRPTQQQPPCLPVQSLPVGPGPSRATESLPADLLADPPRLLVYRVELQNPHGRSAPLLSPAYAASGVAPPPAGILRATPTRAGALLEWTPQPSAAPMELHRTLVSAPNASPPPPKASRDNPFTTQKSAGTDTVLRPAPGSFQKDPGGLRDPSVKAPNTYIYLAHRVRTVTLDGHSLVLNGESSPPVTMVDPDTFPPQAPTGLASIPTPGFTGLPSRPGSIDLSWEPNPETDLLGYNIYRAESSAGPFRKLNADPLAGPAYRDLAAVPGHSYTYRVTALDENHNESPASASIQEMIQ